MGAASCALTRDENEPGAPAGMVAHIASFIAGGLSSLPSALSWLGDGLGCGSSLVTGTTGLLVLSLVMVGALIFAQLYLDV